MPLGNQTHAKPQKSAVQPQRNPWQPRVRHKELAKHLFKKFPSAELSIVHDSSIYSRSFEGISRISSSNSSAFGVSEAKVFPLH